MVWKSHNCMFSKASFKSILFATHAYSLKWNLHHNVCVCENVNNCVTIVQMLLVWWYIIFNYLKYLLWYIWWEVSHSYFYVLFVFGLIVNCKWDSIPCWGWFLRDLNFNLEFVYLCFLVSCNALIDCNIEARFMFIFYLDVCFKL